MAVLPGPPMWAGEGYARFVRLPFFWEAEVLKLGVRRLAAAWREFQPGARRLGAVVV